MRFTRFHVNALSVCGVTLIVSAAMAVLGHECFATSILAGGLGLAINFSDKNGD